MKLQQVHQELVEMRRLKTWSKDFGICVNLEYPYSAALIMALSLTWLNEEGQPEYQSRKPWDKSKWLNLLEHCIKLTASVEVFPVEDFRKALRLSHQGIKADQSETIIHQLLEQ